KFAKGVGGSELERTPERPPQFPLAEGVRRVLARSSVLTRPAGAGGSATGPALLTRASPRPPGKRSASASGNPGGSDFMAASAGHWGRPTPSAHKISTLALEWATSRTPS